MAGEQRRYLALDGLDGVGRVGAGQHEEHIGGTFEIVPAAFQGRDGVIEARRFRVVGNGVDLCAMRSQRVIEGGAKVLGADRAERWQTEGAGPLSEQRIVGGLRVCHVVNLTTATLSDEGQSRSARIALKMTATSITSCNSTPSTGAR